MPDRLHPLQDLAMARRFLIAVMSQGACHELCVLRGQFTRGRRIESAQQYASTLAGWYDDVDKMLADLKRLDGVSAYFTPNPVDPALLARADNQLVRISGQNGRTADENIAQIRWLYVDIDPVRPAGISSTNDELAAAVERRDRVLDTFPELRASALWGQSGNGAWILARLQDLPNVEPSRTSVADALAGIASRFSDAQVTIDVSTRNPARLMCVPGTLKCKGSSRADRPWRLVTLDIR